MKRIFLSLLGLALAVSALGCGQKKPEGLPDLEPVALTVIQDGQPLADAMITLKPLDASNKWTSGGTTDSTGVAKIVTHGQYQGVPVGKYKVAVTKTVGEGDPPPPNPIDEESARVYKEYYDSGKKYEEFSVVDPKLGITETTTLEIEVVKGKNELSVDVGPAVHEKINTGGGASGVGAGAL